MSASGSEPGAGAGEVAADAPALRLRGVSVVRDGRYLLYNVDWSVLAGQHWVVLGPNGAGKSTLMRVAALYLHPSEGEVEVLGRRLGRVDVRRMRHLVGYAAAFLSDGLRPNIRAVDVVVTAIHGALEPWWHDYSDAEREKAHSLLERVGVGPLAEHPFGSLSSGERQRVQIARTLMTDPSLLLLDEPTAALDLAGRESLIRTLEDLSQDPSTPPSVLVTHHTEEIPSGFKHVLLLREGKAIATGEANEVLTSENLSRCFDLELELEHRRGRWWAFAK